MRPRSSLWPVVVLAGCAVGLAAWPPPPASTPPAEKVAAGKAPAKEAKKKGLERLDAWADHSTYDGNTGQFHLEDHVTVIKGNLRVNCDEMIGYVNPKTKQMDRVVAIGNVKMVTVRAITAGEPPPAEDDGWRGSCAKADYDMTGGRLIMQSAPGQPRPRLWRAKGYGEADTIIFYPQKGQYELIGDPIIRGDLPTGPSRSR